MAEQIQVILIGESPSSIGDRTLTSVTDLLSHVDGESLAWPCGTMQRKRRDVMGLPSCPWNRESARLPKQR
jgi:hypothetical protein